MDDFRERAREFLIWLIMDPVIGGTLALAVVVMVGFIVVFIRIKIRDKSGVVRPGTKASALARSGEIPGVVWPEPTYGPGPSMIVEPEEKPRQVTKIVYVKTDHGHMIRNGPDTLDLTDQVESLRIGDDTQPIEVARDGNSQGTDQVQREPDGQAHGGDASGPDRDRPRGGAGRSRSTRGSGTGRRRPRRRS